MKALAAPPPSERGALRGRLFPAGAAAHRSATLTPQPDGSLLLDDGATPRTLAPGALRWSSRIGAIARRATLPDGAVFETHDNDGADALARAHGQRSAGLLHRLERIRAPLLALVLLATLAFFVGLRWTVPWLGDAASRFVPDAVETRIGAAVLETLDRLSFHDSELPAEKRQSIQAEFDALASHAQVAHGKLELLFRRGGRLVGANALALPGGRIVVTDELLALAPAPADLAGVLAHEIAHVEYRHGMRRLGRIAGLSAVVMLMTGDVASATHDMGVIGAGLLDISYSRGFEREADARGIALLRLTGKDPETLAVMLERLGGASSGSAPGWLSSHPPTEERARLIRQAR